MEHITAYVSVGVHLLLIFALWHVIYKKMTPKRFRLNKSVWIAAIVSLLYVFIIAAVATTVKAAWFDRIFLAPCIFVFYFLYFILVLNLVYFIVLLIWKGKTSAPE